MRTSPSAARLAPLLPDIDDVIVYDAPWMKATAPRGHADADRRMIARLRDGHFDAAVIFTVYSQSPLPAAVACYLAEIPLRLGHCRENPYQLLTHWVPEPEPDLATRHEVQRQLDLVRSIGFVMEDRRLRLRVPSSANRYVRRKLDRTGLDPGRPWVVIHPGASAPSRRYPADGFAAAARALARDHDWQIVFTGDRSEQPLVDSIRAAMEAPSHSLAGRLDIAGMAALLQLAPVLIVNNTGPAHIAAAVGTPVVSLYALTNPQHTPWGVPHRLLYHDVPCKFCYKSVCPEAHQNCLRLVAPESIVAAARELLASTRLSATSVSEPLSHSRTCKSRMAASNFLPSPRASRYA